MSDEKTAAARRTAKKAVAVTRAPKTKGRASATTTKSAAGRKTTGKASAGVAPVPAKAVGRAPGVGKTTVTKRTAKTASAAAKPAEPKKPASTHKAPSPVSTTPVGPGSASGASAPAKAAGKGAPGQLAPTMKPMGEVRQTAPAAKKLIERPVEPTREERQRWIATAAYHRAEKRGFAPGYEVQDWLDAEAEVNELIGKARSK